MYIENTKHVETNSESCRRENTNKTDHWKFPKRDGLIFTSKRTSLELDVEVLKKKLFDNYKNTTKYLNDYYYYYKFVFILGHTKCYKRVQTRRHVCRYHWHSINFYNGTKQDGISLQIHKYRLGTVNSNTVNSKFHLIRSFCEIFARFLSFHV